MDTDGTTATRIIRTGPGAVLGAGLAALVLALTACGSADEKASGAAEPGPSTSASPPAPERATASEPTPATEAGSVSAGSLAVSGEGVEGVPFDTDINDAMASLVDRLGAPDTTLDPAQYSRIAGEDGWYESADPISLSWDYHYVTVSCWGGFCATFGGDAADELGLRGWELAVFNRWSPSSGRDDAEQPDVRLAGTGVTLGDTWKQLRAAYPDVVSGGGEGGTLSVSNTPWPAIFDGAAEWRLSGYWDYEHPDRVPADSVVTRLSGGEGPEPGCC